jgi:hypothetical protein
MTWMTERERAFVADAERSRVRAVRESKALDAEVAARTKQRPVLPPLGVSYPCVNGHEGARTFFAGTPCVRCLSEQSRAALRVDAIDYDDTPDLWDENPEDYDEGEDDA